MKTGAFLELLKQHPEKELNFEYQKGTFIPSNYHITEVKNVYIESVDCGGRTAEERQTVIQLWLSPNEKNEKSMEASKATKIFDLTDSIRPLLLDTEILFEYEPNQASTSIYKVDTFEVTNEQLIVKMLVPKTACKPKLELANSGKKISCC